MNTVLTSNMTVGEIVAAMPKASEIFKKFKIDFCCGGNRKLIDVIKEQNLNETEILESLSSHLIEPATQKTKDFTSMSAKELIEHIVDTHHVFVKKSLPEISELTLKILRVHGLNHNELFKVHKLFSSLKTELEQHLLIEEEVLFPQIISYEENKNAENIEVIMQVIKQTESEHEAAGDILKELRNITNDYNVPPDGCNTYLLTYRALEELESDLFQHIHLENNILFKQLSNM